jgi:flagellar FliL protein
MTITESQNRFGAGTADKAAGKSGGEAGKPGDGAAVEGAKKKSRFKSKKFILAMVGVLVLGYGGYSFLMPKKAVPPSGGDVVSMDPTTLNLSDGHYLKVAISIQLVKGKAAAATFFTSQAANLVIDEFSDRTVESLSSNAARQKLMTDLLDKIKVAYPGEVYQVFLTQFVTQ